MSRSIPVHAPPELVRVINHDDRGTFTEWRLDVVDGRIHDDGVITHTASVLRFGPLRFGPTREGHSILGFAPKGMEAT